VFSATRFRVVAAVAALLLAMPATTLATDADGPDDCQRLIEDWGDAPEGSDAYPGVPGRFPTCSANAPAGTQTSDCTANSSPPGPTGFVRHRSVAGLTNYWLGCPAVGVPPMGVDSEPDGKTNSTGNSISNCADILVDCVETAFGMNFGQDECYGSDDAGIATAVTFNACSASDVTFTAYNCSADTVKVQLNILVDWNHDGDWNDNVFCNAALQECAYEWPVKNVQISLAPGCNTIKSPSFLAGPTETTGWMRVTISDDVVSDDFPWRGSAGANQEDALVRGETEDYPIAIVPPTSGCPEYQDFGDAPEEFQAYPGVIGHFPTCTAGTAAGTQEADCTPISSAPGMTGYVRHVRNAGDPAVWLGCQTVPPGSIDGETDGKSNDDGTNTSKCAPIAVDCVENAFGLTFGQDECFGDADAGVVGPVQFSPCDTSRVRLNLYNCGTSVVTAWVNILVDWNGDGDWNDNFACNAAQQQCAYEWALKNFPVTLGPGCTPILTPAILAGPMVGDAWMRVTVTLDVVNDDFPWAGSFQAVGFDSFTGGETEDYPVSIAGSPCDFSYQDFGDAPEDIFAYPSGTIGHFPTCLAPSAAGDVDLACGAMLGTAPGPTGYVRHAVVSADTAKFWLGCGTISIPSIGVDGEIDGKVNLGGGLNSACAPAQFVDCGESYGGLLFGGDECYGDFDAALNGPRLEFGACSTQTVTFKAYSCATVPQKVYLNILIDWNHDGDWNDNAICYHTKACAPEWVVKNQQIELNPGCGSYTSPVFQVADSVGGIWMRITLTRTTVHNDFPWNGSGTEPNGYYQSGETEDYLVIVNRSTVDVGADVPGGLWMAPLVPNPARVTTAIRFALPVEADVAVEAFDVNGRRVRRFTERRMTAGQHTIQWDFRDDAGRALPAGIYMVQLRVGHEVLNRRVIRIR